MQKEMILTTRAPKPFGSYSQAIKFAELLFISGQLPIKEGTQEIISEDPIEQLYQCFENIKNICEAAGTDMNQALKINVYYTDSDVSDNLNNVMENLFTEPYPARIRIRVAGLSKNAKVEIDGVFICPN